MEFINQFKKLFILTNEKIFKIWIIISLFIITSLIDIIGLALLGIFISFIIGNKKLSDYSFLDNYLTNFTFFDENFILYISLFLFFLFLIKTFLSLIIQYFIISFSNQKMADLRMQLIQSYKSLSYSNYIERNTSEFIASVGNHIKNFGIRVFDLEVDFFENTIIKTLKKKKIKYIKQFGYKVSKFFDK